MMKAKRIRITTVLITALAVVLVSISGALAADTGWKDPSANAADTGGDGDGFENNPENAYTDGAPGVASNINNGGVLTGNDRHRYFDYGFSIPSGSTIDGIEVQLDWYLDRDFGTNRMHMELSGNAGSSWTTAKTDSTVTTTEHTTVLGGSTDTWSHAWTVDQLSTTNFRVRLTCDSQSPLRGFFLDWVPVKVYYTPPAGEPDLVVEKSVTIEDGNFIVSYTVTNIGSGPAGESTTCKFVDDVLNGIPDVPAVETQTCPALDSGQSYSGTFDPEPCPCGATLEVIVCADNDNVVAESDEDNNCEVNIVECPGVPDLVVEKEVTFDDDGNFIVSYKVKNQGSCPAGPSEATLYVDGSDV
ncbi:MAG: hypothetical protein KAT65_09845 [Methanophagales archaeon]|nr:hypothetical protein [Methanophagales archaeon]